MHVSSLESRITLKIAKTHISPRAKNPYHPYHTHVTHISHRAKKPYHLILLGQTQAFNTVMFYVFFVCLFVLLTRLVNTAMTILNCFGKADCS